MPYQEIDRVGVIPGVGEKTAEALQRLGITTIHDLLHWYPRTYLDASLPVSISQAGGGRLVAIRATVQSVQKRLSKARRVPMLEAKVTDESGELLLRWFHQPYLAQKLQIGTSWVFIGEAQRFQGDNVMLAPKVEEVPRIFAVYAQSKGLTSKMLRGYIDWILKRVELSKGILPKEVANHWQLEDRSVVLKNLHQPTSLNEIEPAHRYLAVEEVFSFFVRLLAGKPQEQSKGRVIPLNIPLLQELVKDLPFQLTDGQRLLVWEMAQEMASGKAMTRLLNGDVGSGKTVVAALLAATICKTGLSSIFLVPTEILAQQHRRALQGLLTKAGIEVAIWTAATKEEMKAGQIIVGTHALLQEKVALPEIGLLIIDEQHRFGVRQRQLLRNKQGLPPHILSMTATPIPRTLALTLYGNLAVSFLKERPAGRQQIKTKITTEKDRPTMYNHLVEEIQVGQQVFIICPLIKEKETKDSEGEPVLELFSQEELQQQERKTVLAEAARLIKEQPELGRIEAIHGKLKATEKQAIMQRMAAGEIDVLVATSVIEVGIDIPNATVMVIENAERFGLAQLHQLRGRVGRSNLQSYCYLCPGLVTQKILERLRVLEDSNDGFVIAERDLQLRGPGELVGEAQSGLPDFKMASLTDIDFLQEVKQVTEDYLQKHPNFLNEFMASQNELPSEVLE